MTLYIVLSIIHAVLFGLFLWMMMTWAEENFGRKGKP